MATDWWLLAASGPGLSYPQRMAMELQDAEVRLASLAVSDGDGTLMGRALAEVTRRTPVLGSRLAALQSVFEDVAAGRMR